jgi:hypothetical protein
MYWNINSFPNLIRNSNQTTPIEDDDCFSGEELELNNKLRLYWRQYLYWLRSVIVDMVFNVPELEAAQKRLLQTAIDVSATYTEYYNESAGNQFENVFRNNLLITIELVRAIISGNQQAVKEQEQNWINNAGEIGAFYNSINPIWNKEQFQNGLTGLMRSIENLTVLLIQGKYEEAVNSFDQMGVNQLLIINMIFEGIVEQFPERFSVKR